MTKLWVLVVLLSCFGCKPEIVQKRVNLKKDIEEVISVIDGTVAVSIMGMDGDDRISINGDQHLPMQSVFKFHLGATVLREIDKGTFSSGDSIEITRDRLDNRLWSTIRKDYPGGGILTLSEIIRHTISRSDNVGCDLLLEMIGGPKVVQNYMEEIGISEIAVKHNEELIQSDWSLQYLNWTTANEATKTLHLLYENNPQLLSPESHSFLWDVMKMSWLGDISFKTYLPSNTVIAHKTGHSGKNEDGLIGAQNDIAIIFLPDGSHFYLSILISDSKEESDRLYQVFADIGKLTYDYFEGK